MTPSSQGADAPTATGPSRSRLLWVIGGLGVLGLFLWCLILLPSTPEAFPTGDGAVIELYTLIASRGWWEYGPYSRWGWHHPGPLYFYVLALFYKAAHSHSLAVNVGAVAINLIAVTVILWTIARHASATLAVTVTGALALYLWRMTPVLVSAWNPHVVLLPLAALIVCSSAAAAGRLSMLPLTIVMASFVTQTHVALLSSAASATACALVAGLITSVMTRRRARAATAAASAAATTAATGTATGTAADTRTQTSTRGPWFWLGISALIGVVLWLPPIVEQLTVDDGNLSKITRFFLTTNPADPGVPYMPALRVWANSILAPFTRELYFPVGALMAKRANMDIVDIARFSIVLLIVAGWGTARGAVDAWFCRICALLSIVALPAIMRAQGGLGDYMVAWISVIGLMNGAALAAWLLWLVAWLLSSIATIASIARRAAKVRVRWVVPVVTAACLIGVSVQGAIELERLRAERIAARNGDRVRGESVYVALRAFLEKAHVRRPLIRVVGTWDNAAAMVLQLQKRDQPVAIDDDALWLLPFPKNGSEDAELALAERSERHLVTRREGDCMLIERHGLSLHVLLPSLREPITLTCE